MPNYLTVDEFSELTRFFMKVLKRNTGSDGIYEEAWKHVSIALSLISETVSAIDNAYEELA